MRAKDKVPDLMDLYLMVNVCMHEYSFTQQAPLNNFSNVNQKRLNSALRQAKMFIEPSRQLLAAKMYLDLQLLVFVDLKVYCVCYCLKEVDYFWRCSFCIRSFFAMHHN